MIMPVSLICRPVKSGHPFRAEDVVTFRFCHSERGSCMGEVKNFAPQCCYLNKSANIEEKNTVEEKSLLFIFTVLQEVL